MNILHISNTDLAGGRFTGYYMQESLGEADRVEMAVWSKTTNRPHVNLIPPASRIFRLGAELVMYCDGKIGLDGLTGSGGWLMASKDYFARADVVHLHLIHNNSNISILSLPMLSRLKPMIWTLHDPWATTGGCIHSFECDRWLSGCAPRCPHPRRRSLFRRYTPFLQWRVKKAVYRRADITLVATSQWMKDRIERSPLVQHLPCRQIPFGIDLEVFRPRSRLECRRRLGIAGDSKVIAFRGVGLKTDRFKGMRWLMKALEIYQVKAPTILLIVDDGSAFQSMSGRYTIVTLGWVDGEALAEALSAADVFLMPSIQESFGLMAVEAMACGTPVVVFEGTSLPNVIRSPLGGLAVPSMDSGALAAATGRLLNDDQLLRNLGRQARRIAESEYPLSLYVQRHRDLYKEVLDRHRRCKVDR